MNTYETIQRHYKECFKQNVDTFQLNLWWFGVSRGRNAESEAQIKRLGHKQRIEREIAPWDVIVRLACSFVWRKLKDKKIIFADGFTFEKLNKFIYYLLWSDVALTRPVKLKNGQTFNAQTFWSWASENRSRFTPVQKKKTVQKIEDILLQGAYKIMRKRGMTE